MLKDQSAGAPVWYCRAIWEFTTSWFIAWWGSVKVSSINMGMDVPLFPLFVFHAGYCRTQRYATWRQEAGGTTCSIGCQECMYYTRLVIQYAFLISLQVGLFYFTSSVRRILVRWSLHRLLFSQFRGWSVISSQTPVVWIATVVGYVALGLRAHNSRPQGISSCLFSVLMCLQPSAALTAMLPPPVPVPAPQVQLPGLEVPSANGPATEVLCLMNMVTPDELLDLSEYEGELWAHDNDILIIWPVWQSDGG